MDWKSKEGICRAVQDEQHLWPCFHGGAIFALIDEASETVAQTDGTVAVALNVRGPEQPARRWLSDGQTDSFPRCY